VQKGRLFMEALAAVPDRFVEGDALLLMNDGETRAFLVAAVDPVLGVPIALLEGNEPLPLFVALSKHQAATLLGRARRTGKDVAPAPAPEVEAPRGPAPEVEAPQPAPPPANL
jgi:hypothetical protein